MRQLPPPTKKHSAPHSFAVVPAAGRSRRMGRPKLLLPINGTPLLELVLQAWRASRVDKIVVVIHPDDDEALGDICRRQQVDLVTPDLPPSQMKDSVQLALSHIEANYSPQPGDAWLLTPADMPGLAAATIDAVMNAASLQTNSIIRPVSQGKPGHPVLFPWPTAAEVAGLASDEGVNALLQRHPVHSIEVDDAGILQDLDTPADYLRLQNR